MTGYLARLAARAAGAGTSSRPRLPARFEPVDDAPATSRSEEPAAMAGATAPDPAAAPAPSPRPNAAPGRPPEAPHPRDLDETDSDPATATPDGSPAPRARPTRGDADLRERATQGRLQPLVARPAAAPEPVEGDLAGPVVAATTLPVASAPVSSVVAPAAGEVRTVTVVPAEPAPQQAAPSPAPEAPAENVVRISIGRVEVRAQVTPPATPPRPAHKEEAAPGLDLHDYLRGRRGAR